jgi:uncharacterized protein
MVTTSFAHAQSFPVLSGRVVDAANILSPEQEVQLTTKLHALDTQSKRQLVVVTIPDLQGYDISDYGYRLGRAWGIGEKGKNNGALLIVAPKDRKLRIEVGYGLEGILTDALSSRIIRGTIVPHFKANDYPGGIMAGTDALTQLLSLPPDEARKLAEQAAREQQDQAGDNSGFWAVVLIFFLFFFVFPLFSRRSGRSYRSGFGPAVIWGPSVGSGSSWGDGGFGGGGGFSGGGGSFGGGGASGGW